MSKMIQTQSSLRTKVTVSCEVVHASISWKLGCNWVCGRVSCPGDQAFRVGIKYQHCTYAYHASDRYLGPLWISRLCSYNASFSSFTWKYYVLSLFININKGPLLRKNVMALINGLCVPMCL